MEPTVTRKPSSFDLRFILYNLLIVLCLPLLLIYLGVRLLRGKQRRSLPEQLGALPPVIDELGRSTDPVIWMHCASVGEINAAAPILRELRVRVPLSHIVLSVITDTGRDSAQRRDLGVDAIIYFPLDSPLIMSQVLDRMNPRALVLLETEIWPNLLALTRRRGIPSIIVNGRISDRAYPWNRALRPIYRWALGNLTAIQAQSQLDADRFIALGADPERVTVGGNSKFDEAPVALLPAEAARWRQEFGFSDEDQVLLAGSTHEGEEELILSVFDHLRFSNKHLQLIIAPRHPQRGDRVHQLVREHGYDVYRRSHVLAAREAGQEIGAVAAGAVRVVILDTIGELASLYGCADLVIMGGSLVKGLSGHNLLEPIAQGKLVLFGPYISDFRDISAIAIREGLGIQIQSVEELQEECERLLAADEQREAAVHRGPAMLDKYSGASARYAEAVDDLMEAAESHDGIQPQAAPEDLAGDEP